MSDLIDRQVAIYAADEIIARDESGNNDVVKAMTAWKEYIKDLPSAQPEPCEDALGRAENAIGNLPSAQPECHEFPKNALYIRKTDAIEICMEQIESPTNTYFEKGTAEIIKEKITELPSAQPEIIYCRDCKYFELDHFEKVDEFPIPIIVAHEICMKWSDGCRTSKDGWCFMAERRTDETD